MENKFTSQEYEKYINEKTPASPILKNCFNAFWVGGLICTIGQLILEFCKYIQLDLQISYTIVSIFLIFLSAFFTSINIFNKIGKFAGAGSLIPITRFCKLNCITSHRIQIRWLCFRSRR